MFDDNSNDIEMANVQVIGKNFAQKPTENADLIFVVANGSEVAEYANSVENFDALKILITDVKVDACAKFDAFIISNDAEKIINAVKNMVETPGLINLDIADVKMILENCGEAVAYIGAAENPIDAAKNVIGDSEKFKSARSFLLHISGGDDISMIEAMQAMTIIQYKANPEAEILWSLNADESLGKKFEIVIIATRFENEN